ncbi:MAG: hemerythrin domain-containing protein [Methanomassiliicoccus sp.]|nr:hemerythrin domain-containing protein [Methanomassiliicoccus sp.]
MAIPESIRKEHAHLHEVLDKATKEKGGVGEAARAVREVLHPHFLREEEFALPPLGMLSLSGSGPVGDVDGIIAMTERLGQEMPRMLEEHAQIVRSLEVLAARAKEAGKSEYVDFAHDLIHHAKMEEEVMYPTSLLIGAYLRMWKAQKKP